MAANVCAVLDFNRPAIGVNRHRAVRDQARRRVVRGLAGHGHATNAGVDVRRAGRADLGCVLRAVNFDSLDENRFLGIHAEVAGLFDRHRTAGLVNRERPGLDGRPVHRDVAGRGGNGGAASLGPDGLVDDHVLASERRGRSGGDARDLAAFGVGRDEFLLLSAGIGVDCRRERLYFGDLERTAGDGGHFVDHEGAAIGRGVRMAAGIHGDCGVSAVHRNVNVAADGLEADVYAISRAAVEGEVDIALGLALVVLDCKAIQRRAGLVFRVKGRRIEVLGVDVLAGDEGHRFAGLGAG